MNKPRVFIGSCSESVEIAKLLAAELDYDCQPTVWTQGIFQVGETSIDSLYDNIEGFDFAILLLSTDDVVRSRRKQSAAPRDNVIFELGLFMGVLGRNRTFIVYNRAHPPKIPSDLLGITPATYDDREDGNIQAALGPVGTKLKAAFQRLGRRGNSNALNTKLQVCPTIYWAAPHGNIISNNEAKDNLHRHGIKVNLPHNLVLDQIHDTRNMTSENIRKICIQAINNSNMIVVDLDAYGLDSAWEIGYAESKNIPVIGVSRDGNLYRKRPVNCRLYEENFMHGWPNKIIKNKLNELKEYCVGKKVCICSPFKNEAAMKSLRNSTLSRVADKFILPMDTPEISPTSLKHYPMRARNHTIDLMKDSDVALVVLPRYGMDTAWQIGYAYGEGKTIIGWQAPEYGVPIKESSILDHWMHGWGEKPKIIGLDKLAALIVGFYQVGILTINITSVDTRSLT